ncbi:MAG: slipin family protein [Patescibacteria group bacterium]|nr:slipin family protein [Patescibacteria group bacterium]
MYYIIVVVVLIILISIRQVNQYQHGVRFMLGKYTGIAKPGWRIVLPIIQSMKKIDLRIFVIDVPDQDAITKDNISIRVNAVVYYKVRDARAAVIEIHNYEYAISQLAQTTMRDIVGEVNLDGLLAERDEISKRIKAIVDEASDPWGISVESVELKHVELPEDLKRTMGKQAEAEREKRAVIIKAEGEVIAATNMAKAAQMLSSSPGALHLRTLQSLNDLSSDQSNTVVLAVPLEVLRSFEKVTAKQ